MGVTKGHRDLNHGWPVLCSWYTRSCRILIVWPQPTLQCLLSITPPPPPPPPFTQSMLGSIYSTSGFQPEDRLLSSVILWAVLAVASCSSKVIFLSNYYFIHQKPLRVLAKIITSQEKCIDFCFRHYLYIILHIAMTHQSVLHLTLIT